MLKDSLKQEEHELKCTEERRLRQIEKELESDVASEDRLRQIEHELASCDDEDAGSARRSNCSECSGSVGDDVPDDLWEPSSEERNLMKNPEVEQNLIKTPDAKKDLVGLIQESCVSTVASYEEPTDCWVVEDLASSKQGPGALLRAQVADQGDLPVQEKDLDLPGRERELALRIKIQRHGSSSKSCRKLLFGKGTSPYEIQLELPESDGASGSDEGEMTCPIVSVVRNGRRVAEVDPASIHLEV
jgi:hypothetical protein